MLGHPCRIVKGIQGLDPNEGPITPERVRKWIEARAVTSSKVPLGRRFGVKNKAGAAPLVYSEGQVVSEDG
jgi:hypothetical protein